LNDGIGRQYQHCCLPYLAAHERAFGASSKPCVLLRLVAGASANCARPAVNHAARQLGGIPKVTGNKVFAMDIRATDMPGWRG